MWKGVGDAASVVIDNRFERSFIEEFIGVRTDVTGAAGDEDHAIAFSPFCPTTVSSRKAGPPGFFTPRSQSETRFFETFRYRAKTGWETSSRRRIVFISSGRAGAPVSGKPHRTRASYACRARRSHEATPWFHGSRHKAHFDIF